MKPTDWIIFGSSLALLVVFIIAACMAMIAIL